MLLLFGGCFAQSIASQDIAGVYTEKSDDSVGGATIILNQAMVGLEGNKTSDLKAVFNENANCLDFPYISVVDKPLAQLHTTQLPENPLIEEADNNPYYDIHHFNIFGAYNDLILINLSAEYTQRWKLPLKMGNCLWITERKGCVKNL